MTTSSESFQASSTSIKSITIFYCAFIIKDFFTWMGISYPDLFFITKNCQVLKMLCFSSIFTSMLNTVKSLYSNNPILITGRTRNISEQIAIYFVWCVHRHPRTIYNLRYCNFHQANSVIDFKAYTKKLRLILSLY